MFEALTDEEPKFSFRKFYQTPHLLIGFIFDPK